MFYAQINIATQIVEAESMTHGPIDAAHMIEITEQQFGTTLNKRYDAQTGAFLDVALVVQQRATKRAFQSRFPLLPNGVSTKWDAMCLFQQDDGYAASLGVTGATLYGLRMLITTGMQRLNASPFVDMAPGGEAANLTMLLLQGSIPAEFRLSSAEQNTMMTTPLTDAERYTG